MPLSSMPQSLSKVIIHIIFSTKNREPWLDSAIRPRTHAYLATICRDLGGEALCVGGVSDHIHIVATLPRTLSQAELIEQIKKPSSKWIKAVAARYRGFSWQRGYAAFSVSLSRLEAVLQYVERQEEHHRTHTFQDEYRELLHRHRIGFDEQYVWD
jgi:putative transposase